MVRVGAEAEGMFGTLPAGARSCGAQVLVSEGTSDPDGGSWERECLNLIIRGYAVRLDGSDGSDRT